MERAYLHLALTTSGTLLTLFQPCDFGATEIAGLDNDGRLTDWLISRVIDVKKRKNFGIALVLRQT